MIILLLQLAALLDSFLAILADALGTCLSGLFAAGLESGLTG